ncbi:hypothetical protein JKP88DRAFT_346951 [Tribonema minus]|uniref:Uncharacterized protein n=1 Tax=Tribonema minus TaxID=303371 RepID=A0A836C8V2_9STRA|nr:hypothetical protein JKP88DRAFT_346951 [Tribonema minus]
MSRANKKARESLVVIERKSAAGGKGVTNWVSQFSKGELDDRPDGLRETAADLASPELLSHKDRQGFTIMDVRQLVACCLVDILRVYAPQAPYKPEELQSIFALLTQQLRGLSQAVDANDPRTARTHYILQSLASCKSCVILVDLARERVEGGEDALVDFFECLLTGIRAEHLQEVVDNIQEALAVCLEELQSQHCLAFTEVVDNIQEALAVCLEELEEDALTQPLLDALLMGLLPVTRSENPKSYQLAQPLLDALLMGLLPVTRSENPKSYQLAQPLLDALLMGLLPVTRSENPKSYQLVQSPKSYQLAQNPKSYQLEQSLLRRCFNRVFMPITQFVTSVLTGNGKGVRNAQSELTEHVRLLVLELHQTTTGGPDSSTTTGGFDSSVNPQFLLYIMPVLSQQLLSTETEVRLDAALLLGRLFASQHAEYGEQFAPTWADFMTRFKDVDAKAHGRAADSVHTQLQGRQGMPSNGVRKLMVTRGTEILQRKPALRPALQDALASRLVDPESEVRTEAVHAVCDCASNCLEAVSEALLRAVGERLRDKKAQIRKDAATGLAQVFAKHVSRRWSDVAPPQLRQPPADVEAKLSWVPASVVKSYSLRDAELQSRLLQLVDDILLPTRETPAVRAAGAVALWRGFDAAARTGVQRMLEDRRRCREAVLRYLVLRDTAKKTAAAAKAEREEQVEEAFRAIAALVPTPDGQTDVLHRLHEQRDKKIFQLLRSLCEDGEAAAATAAAPAAAREDLVKRVGSKTALGDYLMALTRRCALFSFGAGMFQEVVQVCRVGLEERDEELYTPALEVMAMQAGVFPAHLRAQLGGLLPLYKEAGELADAPEVQTAIMKLMSHMPRRDGGGSGSGAGDAVPAAFKRQLQVAITSTGAAEHAEAAVRAMGALLPEDNPLIAATLKELASPRLLAPHGERLGPTLAALRVFALRHARAFAPHADAVARFVEEHVVGPAHVDAVACFVEEHIVGPKAAQAAADEPSPAPAKGGRGKKAKAAAAAAASKGRAAAAAQLIAPGLRLLSARLLPLPLPRAPAADADGDASDASSSGSGGSTAVLSTKAVKERAAKLLGLLLAALDDGGAPPGWTTLDDESKAEVRLAAATCILELMCRSHLQPLLSAQRWHTLAYTLCDEDASVRERFAQELARAVNNRMATHRYAAMLCLVGAEPEAARREARAALAAWLRHMRSHHAAQSAAAKSAESAAAKSAEEREALSVLLPEYVLPCALHMLAHLPGLGNLAEEGPGAHKMQKCLAFLLQCLMEGQDCGGDADNLSFLLQMINTIRTRLVERQDGGGDADNLSFLLQMINTIRTSYCDAMAPDSGQLHVVADAARAFLLSRVKDAARAFLLSRVKTPENLQPYPVQIFLPTDMFAHRVPSATKRAAATLTMDPARAESALRGVLATPMTKVGPSRGGAGGSKRSGGGGSGAARGGAPPRLPDWGSPIVSANGSAKRPAARPESGSSGTDGDASESETDEPPAKANGKRAKGTAAAAAAPTAYGKKAKRADAAGKKRSPQKAAKAQQQRPRPRRAARTSTSMEEEPSASDAESAHSTPEAAEESAEEEEVLQPKAAASRGDAGKPQRGRGRGRGRGGRGAATAGKRAAASSPPPAKKQKRRAPTPEPEQRSESEPEAAPPAAAASGGISSDEDSDAQELAAAARRRRAMRGLYCVCAVLVDCPCRAHVGEDWDPDAHINEDQVMDMFIKFACSAVDANDDDDDDDDDDAQRPAAGPVRVQAPAAAMVWMANGDPYAAGVPKPAPSMAVAMSATPCGNERHAIDKYTPYESRKSPSAVLTPP